MTYDFHSEPKHIFLTTPIQTVHFFFKMVLLFIFFIYVLALLPSFSPVQFSHSVVSDSLWPHGLHHARPPCSSPTPGAWSNSCPSSQSNWTYVHPTISTSVVPFYYHLQSFPSSGSFSVSQFFTSGGQIIGVSASASVLPMNIQDWFPLGLTGLISLQSKGFSRVFPNTTVQKHQFFGTWLLEKP